VAAQEKSLNLPQHVHYGTENEDMDVCVSMHAHKRHNIPMQAFAYVQKTYATSSACGMF